MPQRDYAPTQWGAPWPHVESNNDKLYGVIAACWSACDSDAPDDYRSCGMEPTSKGRAHMWHQHVSERYPERATNQPSHA